MQFVRSMRQDRGKYRFEKEVAGALGFEPRYQAPKACVLPLDDAPVEFSERLSGGRMAPGTPAARSFESGPLVRSGLGVVAQRGAPWNSSETDQTRRTRFPKAWPPRLRRSGGG